MPSHRFVLAFSELFLNLLLCIYVSHAEGFMRISLTLGYSFVATRGDSGSTQDLLHIVTQCKYSLSLSSQVCFIIRLQACFSVSRSDSCCGFLLAQFFRVREAVP